MAKIKRGSLVQKLLTGAIGLAAFLLVMLLIGVIGTQLAFVGAIADFGYLGWTLGGAIAFMFALPIEEALGKAIKYK